MDKNWIILIAGGHSAGKKTVSNDIQTHIEELAGKTDLKLNVQVIHMRDYANVDESCLSSDVPSSPQNYDFDHLFLDLSEYIGSKGSSLQSSLSSLPPKTLPTVTLVEGLYALYDSRIREMATMKVFVDSDGDTRLSRWILRDVVSLKKCKLGDVLNNYLTRARPEMLQSIAPTKSFADVVLPRGSEESGISLISTSIYDIVHGDMHKVSSLIGASSPYLGYDSPTLAPRVSKLNLRRDSFDSQSGRFHDLS